MLHRPAISGLVAVTTFRDRNRFYIPSLFSGIDRRQCHRRPTQFRPAHAACTMSSSSRVPVHGAGCRPCLSIGPPKRPAAKAQRIPHGTYSVAQEARNRSPYDVLLAVGYSALFAVHTLAGSVSRETTHFARIMCPIRAMERVVVRKVPQRSFEVRSDDRDQRRIVGGTAIAV